MERVRRRQLLGAEAAIAIRSRFFKDQFHSIGRFAVRHAVGANVSRLYFDGKYRQPGLSELSASEHCDRWPLPFRSAAMARRGRHPRYQLVQSVRDCTLSNESRLATVCHGPLLAPGQPLHPSTDSPVRPDFYRRDAEWRLADSAAADEPILYARSRTPGRRRWSAPH